MEKESPIQRKINKNGWVLSRVPDWLKEFVIDLAEEEYCGDYGACLAKLVRDAIEYNQLKTKFFNNEVGMKVSFQPKEKEEKGIRMANGKKLNTIGGKE